mmetsp:Transcript_3740/g.10705  ORF Transcript_3740/g.10705 Transcript_3740/m.10705 type:complete len:205 (-) Transcript_3740:1737-2351(-)
MQHRAHHALQSGHVHLRRRGGVGVGHAQGHHLVQEGQAGHPAHHPRVDHVHLGEGQPHARGVGGNERPRAHHGRVEDVLRPRGALVLLSGGCRLPLGPRPPVTMGDPSPAPGRPAVPLLARANGLAVRPLGLLLRPLLRQPLPPLLHDAGRAQAAGPLLPLPPRDDHAEGVVVRQVDLADDKVVPLALPPRRRGELAEVSVPVP